MFPSRSLWPSIFGSLLISLGLIALIWGGRRLNIREGTILKLIMHQNVKFIRFAFALAMFYLGAALVLGWFE